MPSVFVPTKDWQPIAPGQHIPAGCHVRMNLETGTKEAKLLDPESTSNADCSLVPASANHGPEARDGQSSIPPKVSEEKNRSPHDWQGLLNWSLSHMDTTKPSEYKPMDPERKKWLMNALNSLSEDEVQLMKNALETLNKNYTGCFDGSLDDGDLQAKENALETLDELVDMLGNAQDMIPLGGFPAVIGLLNSSYSSLQWRAAGVLATCVQNNPLCQEYALSHETLGKLIGLLDGDADGAVKVKALYALGGLVRSNQAALKAFLLSNGLETLKHCVAQYQDQPKLATKAAFLLGQLIHSGMVEPEVIIQSGIVHVVGLALQTSDVQLQELCLDLLAALRSAPSFVNAAQLPGVDLAKRVRAVQADLEKTPIEDQPALQEVMAHITDIIQALS